MHIYAFGRNTISAVTNTAIGVVQWGQLCDRHHNLSDLYVTFFNPNSDPKKRYDHPLQLGNWISRRLLKCSSGNGQFKSTQPVNRANGNGTQTGWWDFEGGKGLWWGVSQWGLPCSGKWPREAFGRQRRLLSISTKNQKTGKSTEKEGARRQDSH